MSEFTYQLAKSAGIIKRDEAAENTARKLLFVAPFGNQLPDDGVLTYFVVDDFRSMLDVDAGTVLLFTEDKARQLSVLCADRAVFDVDVKILLGVPGSTYDRWFEEATYQCEVMSHSPLLTELREEGVVDQILDSKREKSVSERELRQRSRSDGTVRYHDNDSIGLASEEAE